MTRFAVLFPAAVLALSACDSPPQQVSAPPIESAPGVPVSAADKLTAQGFGPLKIGMSRAEVEAAMGPDSRPDAVGGPDPAACTLFHPRDAPAGVMAMVEGGVLTSVWLDPPAAAETNRALNIGDAAAEVRRVYGDQVQAMPHKYEAAPAEYLFVWTTPDHAGPAARGLKYEIGRDGRVVRIAGGGPSIQYVEGCA
ncbi:hypothetical protein D8I30_12555 [Brevundimonas naejangsanensis]|uniref:Uncharacterized protein n=1 Tax=Brevundimonas naejangsanensis TaxID=588932 RepID=A0A494RHR1_9CAUL|nr:hypothetical protein [Brevundimonas naejangsanensis]AYG95911.1 hypothetical protein D8I30_12555 [Brevundimonas naejangsanensis]